MENNKPDHTKFYEAIFKFSSDPLNMNIVEDLLDKKKDKEI